MRPIICDACQMRIDKVGAYESAPFGDGPIRSRERIRVDLDGFGVR